MRVVLQHLLGELAGHRLDNVLGLTSLEQVRDDRVAQVVESEAGQAGGVSQRPPGAVPLFRRLGRVVVVMLPLAPEIMLLVRVPEFSARLSIRMMASRAITITLASMTTSGHNVTMREVRIAELKARLSEYLRAVRRGETIAVLDRETPVAQIVPVRDRTALRIRKPAPGTPPPNRVPLPKRLKSTIDVVQLLLEERQLHR